MTIREKILEDIKTAMKEKDNFKRDTLRLINSAIKQVEVDERAQMSDEKVLAILQTQIKRRIDSVEQYKKGGRDDLAQNEENEIKIICEYMPKQLSEDELRAEIEAIISELGSGANIGTVMKIAKEKIGARSDGKSISDCAKKLLS
ncbi:GatB/YqeY domain-containing protein [Campylobacter sp. RM16187]|uniref:GatB/YqeY domain-containing protein n=1 Tax=Campylobacter sp. RM16187 TaxID=1660063 RepID=UPI0021B6AE70|nr:GatB/YqeY domain-containing protein [Campylobacter sp. RM16187]QKG29392.1 putative GatB/YqeY family protein [Campylobacter sp. RM16187]